MAMTISAIHVYPVKGLGGCALSRTEVTPHGLRDDRRFGVAFADAAAAADLLGGAVAWKPWEVFVSLKKYEAAARVQARVTAAEGGGGTRLTLCHKDGRTISGNPQDAAERRGLEDFLQAVLQGEGAGGGGGLRLMESGAQPLWDEHGEVLSCINLESLSALEAAEQVPPQAARYRANLEFAGGVPWEEEAWRGVLHIGGVRLRVGEGIPRCAATLVNPDTAVRDCHPPKSLIAARGHNEFGVFLQVVEGGELACGMEVTLEPSE